VGFLVIGLRLIQRSGGSEDGTTAADEGPTAD
jgi:hypothetical protein